MKGKLRCPHCGRTFRPARSNQTLCDACEKQERIARSAAKANSGAVATRPNAASAAPIKVVSSAPPPDTGLYGSAAIREEQRREQQRRDDERRAQEQRLREQQREQQRAHEQAQRSHDRHDAHGPHGDHHDHHGAHEHPQGPHAAYGQKHSARPGERPGDKAARAERPVPAPRPPKQPRPAPLRFELTDDLRARIEARYLELAQPIEFDGIRTQIAADLGAPKSLVKRAVAELRAKMQLPSWWELQSYSGAEADLERIRMAYLPHLPVPDVGIHKSLAEALNLDPRTVYQGIRRIRAEMRLPQYNPPEKHGDLPLQPSTEANDGAVNGVASPVASAANAATATTATTARGDGGENAAE